MKAFIAAIVIATATAVAAAYMLDDSFQVTAYEAFTTSGARVDNPGRNLVEF